MSKLERLICEPGDSDTLLPTTEEGVFYFPDIAEHFHAARYRWYFSAAAVAIEFCEFNPASISRSPNPLRLQWAIARRFY